MVVVGNTPSLPAPFPLLDPDLDLDLDSAADMAAILGVVLMVRSHSIVFGSDSMSLGRATDLADWCRESASVDNMVDWGSEYPDAPRS